MRSVNEILNTHSSSPSKITVRTFVADRREPDESEEETPSQPYVLIEGDADALRFVAELILAQVDSDYGCTLDIHPNGAGSKHFSDASTLGIYVHRLPCDLQPGHVLGRSSSQTT
jgi:hypothetical protein